MKCPKCGYENNPNAKFCEQCGSPMGLQIPMQPLPQKKKKPWYTRWWIWVLIGIGTTALMFGFTHTVEKTSDGERKTLPITETQNIHENDTTSKNSSNHESEKNAKVFSTGDTFNDSGFEITMVSHEEFKDYSEFHTPSEGCYVLKVDFSIKNGDKSKRSYGYSYFECYADNKPAKQWYAYEDGTNEIPLVDDLTSGREVSGSVYYEVPYDSDVIEIEYSKYGYWTSSPVVFKVK